MSDYNFYGKIDTLVDGLDLPQNCFEASCRVCDDITELEGFSHFFVSSGGFDAVVATSVFLGARQERCPVPAQVIRDFIRTSPVFELSVDGNGLSRLARKFRARVVDDPVFVGAEDFIGFYCDRLDFPVTQEELEQELDVSQVAVRSCYKEVVEELTGVDTSGQELERVDVTAASFGFYGDSVEDFALHLLNSVEDEVRASPQVLAASVLYVAGKVI